MYDFFMSYARTENDAFLQKFFDELSREVRRALAKKEREIVGFFDQRELTRGDVWQEEIFTALNESAALIALYSPSFFASENCMREVNAFLERQNARDRNNIAQQAVILPIEWYPIESRNVPEALRKFQFREGDPQSPINRHGVRLVRKLRKPGYDELLMSLASQIAACSKAAAQLPAATRKDASSGPAPAKAAQPLGPSHVSFIYVACRDSEPTLTPRSAYYGNGPNRWRPYQPSDPQSVGPLSQSVAADQDLTSDELSFDEHVVDALRDAEKRRNVVILIVDGWSVSVGTYADVLSKFDERNFANCAVIAPWNDADPLTQRHLEELKANVRGVLRRWCASGPLRFTDAPTTMPQFRTTLATTLTSLRAQIFNSFPGRNTPFYPRPILTNTVDRAA